ncbi:MAG TPA: alpha/beta fold hydrolase, partial [Polyangiaceae bacterium]|nr:alpha/beta fold hydrolase [Polyangiaceae bacterium]
RGRLHYVDEGKGPAVVFVHGTPSWSYDYRELIANLRARHRCIALDHLGFGLSDRPLRVDDPLSLHSQNLERLLASLGVDRYALVAHDFGGPIALPLALEHPERLSALCLLNTWAWSMDEDPEFSKVRRLAGSALMRFLYRYANFSARVMVKSAWGKRTPLTGRRHRHFTGLFPNRASREGTWAFARSLVTDDERFDALGARLAALRDVPTLVAWGMADKFVGAPHLARWKRELPNARFLELEGVGHFPQDEAPNDVLAALEPLLEATR